MSAIDAYLANNARHAAGREKRALPAPPAQRIAVVACMDARLETGALLGLAEGDAHVIRNAGGVVTDDVIRSLTISQHLLGTEAIMVVFHTQCGMLGLEDDALAAQVEARTGVAPPFVAGGFSDLEQGLRDSLARLRQSQFLLHKDEIRGFICDVETGILREVE